MDEDDPADLLLNMCAVVGLGVLMYVITYVILSQ